MWFVLGFISVIFLSIVFSYKSYNKEISKIEKEADEKLALELLKPKYLIRFYLKDYPITPYETISFEPKISWWMARRYSLLTSKYLAECTLKDSYKDGYFTDQNNKTYPTCNITEAYIKEVL